jgi:tetratricopeptide (TPR) repeat protein
VWQQAFDILTIRVIDVDTWISMGLKLLKEGQIERGIKCFDRAVKLNPDRKQIGAAAGALLEIGRPKESLIYFDKYIALAGDDDQGWAGKGWCLAQIGQMNEALECANKAMSINPTNAWTRDLAAMIYLDKKEYERVCSIEMETLQYHPDYIRAYVTWSEAFSLLGKLNDAVETLQRAIEVLHQQDWVKSEDAQNVHLQLGLIYAMKGERDLALSHFREGRAALADDRGRAMEEGYEILTILGLSLEGTPKVRYARLIAISEIRQSKGYKDLAEKIIAEGSVADCIDYDWLSEDPVDTVTALLKWWSPAKIEQLAHALTRADMQMLTETADKAMAEFIHKR